MRVAGPPVELPAQAVIVIVSEFVPAWNPTVVEELVTGATVVVEETGEVV